ncbi:sigma-70 family RNA polymerase sigma factor [Aquimarina muelleri]|uniref:DNA-directed RNA polymerase sigma-70 factor n=1 Tax=Aquimarina muelleri TaxID=279356 RepID=A0A918JVG0_9FLAO|nr:sigma-70 family RNA polymerase sigma factor [Aquimarina muelleri]MCX2764796.1 sigma-70 family RNA polymerase sigma factor [Aquimarina muelleri]GGX08535.1 DNA-directed RNA polymerase sigma-70 factor [Aquimarina muelleri]
MNELAFEKLYKMYWKKLYAICLSKTNNAEASQEIVHDVYVSIWKRRDKFVVTQGVENYLLKSTRSKIIDYYRKNSKNQVKVYPSEDVCKGNHFDVNAITHNSALHYFLESDLELIVTQLPFQCQKVYRLSREKQLTTNEIAQKLNISQKTVKNHLTKALSFLQKHIRQSLVHQ